MTGYGLRLVILAFLSLTLEVTSQNMCLMHESNTLFAQVTNFTVTTFNQSLGGTAVSKSFFAFHRHQRAECRWIIQAPPKHYVHLILSHVQILSAAPPKRGDCIHVHNGMDTGFRSAVLESSCKLPPRSTYNSTGPFLLVVFTQGDVAGRRWFSLTYTAVKSEHVIWHCPFGRIGGFIFTAILIGVLISSCRGHAISLLLQPYAKCLETCAIHLRCFSYQLRERYLSLGRRDLGRDEMHARGDGSAMGISPNRARLGGEARGVVRMLDILRGQRGDAGSLCGPGTAAGCNNRIDSPCVAPNSAPPPPYSSSESMPSPQQSAQIPTPAPPSYRSCTDLVAELNSVRNVACPPSYDTSVEVAPPPSYESLFKDGDSSGVCG